MNERRKHARFRSSTIMQYKDRILTMATDTATKDISLGGICFFSDKKLKPGMIIKLKLYYDAKSPARTLKGKVVWSQEYNDKVSKGFLNGLTFVG